jgi:hypothetical protein
MGRNRIIGFELEIKSPSSMEPYTWVSIVNPGLTSIMPSILEGKFHIILAN